MADHRVPVAPLLAAFGVAATVTRPAPDNTPIATTAIWLGAEEDSQPYGTDFTRREPRRLLTLSRAALPTLLRGSLVEAPEVAGGTVQRWRVDGLAQPVDPEWWYALVMLDV